MSEVKFFEKTKSDYKDLESFLVKNELVDDRRIWFAGYDNYKKSTQNAIAGNLLYGYKRLIIVSIKDNEINYLNNSKKGFRLSVIGTLDEKHKVTSLRRIIYPTVDITCNDGQFYSIKVIKHKESIKEFKKTIK
jgi:hypothetical protein